MDRNNQVIFNNQLKFNFKIIQVNINKYFLRCFKDSVKKKLLYWDKKLNELTKLIIY